MSGLLPPNVLSYEGQVAVPYINRTSPPTTAFNKFPVPTLWIDTANKNAYLLVNVALGIADWAPIGGVTAQISTLTGNSGGAVGPTVGNVNVVGDGTTVNVVGNPGTSTLTISAITTGETWQAISANQTLAVSHGYICISPGGALSLALPATSVVGDTIEVTLDGATSFTITQTAGQRIRLGNQQTTAGGGGSLSSTAQGDSIRLVCSVADLKWNVVSSIGNLTVV